MLTPVVAGAILAAMHIEPYDPQQLEPVIRFALDAWASVFDSLHGALGPDLYREFYPDWRVNQRAAIEEVLASPEIHTWVAVEDAAPVGFVSVKYAPGEVMGEVYMVAVDPAYQRHGVGAALTQHALDWLTEAGASVAMVETGGDPGHAPARRTYEKLGFELLPIARYFKKL